MQVAIYSSNPNCPHSVEKDEKMFKVKEELNDLAQRFGLTHEFTVSKSQELDRIVNSYMVSL